MIASPFCFRVLVRKLLTTKTVLDAQCALLDNWVVYCLGLEYTCQRRRSIVSSSSASKTLLCSSTNANGVWSLGKGVLPHCFSHPVAAFDRRFFFGALCFVPSYFAFLVLRFSAFLRTSSMLLDTNFEESAGSGVLFTPTPRNLFHSDVDNCMILLTAVSRSRKNGRSDCDNPDNCRGAATIFGSFRTPASLRLFLGCAIFWV